MNKKRLLILIIIVALLIIVLWFSEIIPKQIARIYGTSYMKNNYPEMKLEYKGIEWNKYYGDYIITFKDKNNQNYGCVIGPKYLPISIGQGINAIEETYKESYSSNTTASFIPDGMDIANGNDVKVPVNEIRYNRDAKNVIIEVLEDTITKESVEILITDNNKDQYGWGVEFRVQEKINGEWVDLKNISDNVSWIEIAYLLNENNQITQKLNIKEYYGSLSKGLYRIVKPVYDNDYIDLYSNEFEIK